ncbi:MAG: EAL domain-containing protein [Comamonas sp.]
MPLDLTHLDSDIVDAVPQGVLVCDAQGVFLRVNAAYERLTGYAAHELVNGSTTVAQVHEAAELLLRGGQLPFDTARGALGQPVILARSPTGGTPPATGPAAVWRYRRSDGSTLNVQVAWSRLAGGHGAERYMAVVVPDSGGRDPLQNAGYDDFHEGWTQLPNVAWFQTQATHQLQLTHQRERASAVLVLEIDHMARLRDSLGDALLGQVLQLCGSHVRGVVGPDAVLAALDHGLLACLVEGDEPQVDVLIGKLQCRLAQPIQLADRHLRLMVSVGATACPPQAPIDAGELVHRARVALGAAQAAPIGGQARWFQESMRAEAMDRLELEGLLRDALEKQQFSLVFQPQVNLATGRILLMETLLRWQCPGRGSISPSVFVPVAEDLGLIVPIGEWVLREACREVGRLRRLLAGQAGEVPQVSVNVSARQLLQPGLIELVQSALDDAGLAPEHLEIEVTETVLLGDTEGALATLEGLRVLGVGLAIDDFGTGYSSFSYLTQFPFDRLKIDRSLIVNIDQPGKGYAIVSAIVSLAHALEMLVTAEGVETAGQAEALKRLDCDDVQGYWFSRPLAPQALERVLMAIAEPEARA